MKTVLLFTALLVSALSAQVWQPTTLINEYVKCVAVNPANGNIFAGTLYSEGIFRSTDNGSTWVVKNNGLSAHEVYAIAIGQNGNMFAATWGGGMFRSTDNGENWEQINNGITNSVLFSTTVNPINNYVFAGAGGSGIYLSTNQGNSWTLVNNGLTSFNILSLAANVNGNIFAGTYDGVFRSTDNGSSWLPTTITTGWGEAFATSSPLYNVFAGVSGAGVFRSTDNGATFTAVNTGLTQNSVYAIANTASGFVYAGIFGGGGIFRSTNNGDTWTEYSSGLTNGDIRSIAIAPNGYIYAGTFGSGVFRSVDPVPVELISFTASMNGNTVELNWQTATETNNSGFEVQKSTDNKLFTDEAFVAGAGTSASPKFYTFKDEDVLPGMKYFYRLKQIDLDGSFIFSNTIETEIPLPGSYSLDQNYPNPFNPNTTIQFTLPEDAASVKLTIYNSLAEKIAELINTPLKAGTHQFNWTPENVPSGIYIYTLSTEHFTAAKRMVLLK